jgi:hypothetical protein
MLAIELHNLFLAGVSAAFAPASPAGDTATIVQTVRIAPVALTGRLLDGATRRAVAGHPLSLLDAEGKLVAELTSNGDGNYTLPVLAAGNYVLSVQEDLQLQLAVDANAKIAQLDIVVPQGQGQPRPRVQDPKQTPPAPGGAAPKPKGKPAPKPLPSPGLGVGTWALIGGGAAVVAAPVIANAADSGGGGESPVSPSGLGVRR